MCCEDCTQWLGSLLPFGSSLTAIMSTACVTNRHLRLSNGKITYKGPRRIQAYVPNQLCGGLWDLLSSWHLEGAPIALLSVLPGKADQSTPARRCTAWGLWGRGSGFRRYDSLLLRLAQAGRDTYQISRHRGTGPKHIWNWSYIWFPTMAGKFRLGNSM